jgi:hypothetical protein
MKSLKHHRVIAADLARRYVEFHDGEDPRQIRLWGLESWQNISKAANEGVIRTGSTTWHKGMNWFTPSEEFLVQVVIPLIEIYRNEEGDRNLRWFEGNYPNSIWSFNYENK